eukprot:TRINITY_DN208_c0_g1_i1.p1 TRINITY_DN208_c0_g1~~TRINITY_DN208_c0_g1_i1.p1  ORF type:complete len:153 (+),score=43.10 TRINITY_DN208_c0_g1_i1:45-461(+)
MAQFLQTLLRPWIGVTKLFYKNPLVLKLESAYPALKPLNDVTYLAPTFKWALSIVPLTQTFRGSVPVEKVDFEQSLSLSFTGMVWAYYATLIQPQNAGSMMLCACNAAMGSVNGYNAFRKFRYNQQQKQQQQPPKNSN